MERKRTQRWFKSSFQRLGFCWLCMWTSTCIVFMFSVGIEGQFHQKDSAIYNFIKNVEYGDTGHALLTEASVVLITGAAGFIGSELALALHRTYSPKRIICVDRMGDRPKGEEELARFEYQRQRVFNVMQTLGDKGVFYRVDFSPMIPEYYDAGGSSVLDHIFRENIDITHVVHLADPYPHSALQAVPREKEIPKAGMMEALLEQLVKHEREVLSQSSEGDGGNTNKYNPPNFVYASSNEVYPQHKKAKEYKADESIGQPLHVLLEESQALSTPSSLRGVSKMMDEMIAKLYYDTKGIYSVGLRFFSVYGPWGVPGSPMFEMAQRAVSGELNGLNNKFETSNYHGINGNDQKGDEDVNENEKFPTDSWKKQKHDFVYIDDAVDVIMAAMQFRSSLSQEGTGRQTSSPHPIIFNVASGEGHSLEDVLQTMHEFFPPEGKKYITSSSSTATNELMDSIGSTQRSKSLLGYQPQVSLRDGIIKTLAWHYDRTFPYGGFGSKGNRNKDGEFKSREGNIDMVTRHGMAGCLPFDKECLRGTPVFPCSSECAHKAQCTKSLYDEVIAMTQKLTTSCETVLYTVDLDNSLKSLPSANPKFQNPKSFFKGTCNLAFVSKHSVLIQNKRQKLQSMGSGPGGHDAEVYRDGSWVLIPLNVIPTLDGDDDSERFVNNGIMRLLPKLSPGLFFQSKTTKRAVYIDPDIVIDNISKLLIESTLQPYNEKMEGATAMLIGRDAPKGYGTDNDVDEEEIILKLLDPNYRHQTLESTNSRVQNAAYRMVKLAVSDNQFGNKFLELLDSRWIVHGLQSDDGRLFRCDILGEIFQWEVTSDRSALEFIIGLHDMWSRMIAKSSGTDPWWIGDNVDTIPEGQQSTAVGRRRLQEDEVAVVDTSGRNSREEKEVSPQAEDEHDEAEEADDDETDNNAADDDETDEDSEEETPKEGSGGEEKDRGEFVADAVAQEEVKAGEEKRGDSSDEGQEERKSIDDKKIKENDGKESKERDSSSWMGILSSSRIKYFVRIVPSSEVGITSIGTS